MPFGLSPHSDAGTVGLSVVAKKRSGEASLKIREISESELIELLSAHRVFSGVPPSELQWVAARAQFKELDVGDLPASPKQGPVSELYIILSGRLVIYLDRTGPKKVMTWGAGDVSGMLPYSRLTVSPGEARVEEPAEMITLHKDHLPELTRECPEITKRLVWVMLDRARHFTQYDLRDEKMKSLGRLAAGLAHEMDNPASAVIRSSKLLVPLLDEADAAARALGAAAIDAAQYAAIEEMRNGCLTAPVSHVRSPLEQARHEEEISDWITDRDVVIPNVDALAEAPVSVELLDNLERIIPADLLPIALRWVANGCAIRALAAEIGEAASRISHLVKAVKGFTQMDASGTPQLLDVPLGLSQTLSVLRSKARSKSVRVAIHAASELPRVLAVGGELNQVWANLIDNAVDAVAPGGTIEIFVERQAESIVVRVVDDGPGIPARDQERIFEPFYTTKPVGSGTGLGLDIVRRLVTGNDGDIEVSSVPGRTEFRVSLPIASEPREAESTS